VGTVLTYETPRRVRYGFEGDLGVKKFVAIVLVSLVALPWAALPAAKGAACPMPRSAVRAACSYCTPAVATASSTPTLQSGCCRFRSDAERVPAQAGSLGAAPKPLQTPDFTSSLPPAVGDGSMIASAPAQRFADPGRLALAPTPPTRTTHLLLSSPLLPGRPRVRRTVVPWHPSALAIPRGGIRKSPTWR
jgi:hypothetical protein